MLFKKGPFIHSHHLPVNPCGTTLPVALYSRIASLSCTCTIIGRMAIL